MKRLVYLATAALMAMLILVPFAMAQGEQTMMKEQTMMTETTQPLPKSGGPAIEGPTVLLPAAALLLGSGVLGYAVLRRRQIGQ